MEIFKKIKQAKNKTIKEIKFIDCEHSICIIFIDNSCIFFDSNIDEDEWAYIDVDENPSLENELEAEIITKKEYDAKVKKEEEYIKMFKEQTELKTLKKLKEKYEGVKNES